MRLSHSQGLTDETDEFSTPRESCACRGCVLSCTHERAGHWLNVTTPRDDGRLDERNDAVPHVTFALRRYHTMTISLHRRRK